jgi:hypothetical protein
MAKKKSVDSVVGFTPSFGVSMSNAWLTDKVVQRCGWLVASYKRWTGRDLVENLPQDPAARARALYNAPKVIVSHGTEPDPIFWFANLTAQHLWEVDWQSFIQMPSRQSVELGEYDDRERLLARAQSLGYVDDYQGVRISRLGRRFRIQNVLLWNVHNEQDQPTGQAATFSNWTFL